MNDIIFTAEQTKKLVMSIILYHPYIHGACKKCQNHYFSDGGELRCLAVHPGINTAICCQISECKKYKEKE